MKVLIVEDNAEMRRLLRSLVGRLAEAVYECEDGAEALSAYGEAHLTAADWVLMDVVMSGLDGLRATRLLRAAWPDARVCIVTAHDQPGLREAAAEAGASGYVLKEQLHAVRRILQAG